MVDGDAPVRYSCFIHTRQPAALRRAGIPIGSQYDGFVTAQVTLDQLRTLAAMPQVTYLAAPRQVQPFNREAGAAVGAHLLNQGFVYGTQYQGQGTIVCIVDTGLDWNHPDFRDAQGNSRVLAIWDQTLTKNLAGSTNEQTPQDRRGTNFDCCNWGVEYSQAEINADITGDPTAPAVRTRDLEGHGTHVAGTAAGNGRSVAGGRFAGIAPQADLLIVKTNFLNTGIADALTYARLVSAAEGKPVVVNLSLGTQATAHDGTNILDMVANQFVNSGPGRVLVAAAGNEGGKNMHYSARIEPGQTRTVEFAVPDYQPNPGISNDEFKTLLYFNNNANVTATLRSPNNLAATAVPGSTGQNPSADGNLVVDNFFDPNNSKRFVEAEFADDNAAPAPASGIWALDLTNNGGSAVTFDGWIITNGSPFTAEPSGLGVTFDDVSTIGTPGTAAEAITVGSFMQKFRYYAYNPPSGPFGPRSYATDRTDDISIFSSRGPLVGGALKPDLTAPGQAVASSLSASVPFSNRLSDPSQQHFFTQGTSMACPVVAGCAALLLQQTPALTGAQVKNLLISTASKDAFTTNTVNNTWGHGKTDVYRAMVELLDPQALPLTQRKTYAYRAVANDGNALPDGFGAGVRISPDFSGQLTGVYAHTWLNLPPAGSQFTLQAFTDNGGLPGPTALGPPVTITVGSNLARMGWNYLDLVSANLQVTAGTDFWLVLTNVTGGNFELGVNNAGPFTNRSALSDGAVWTSASLDWALRAEITQRDDAVLWNGQAWLGGSPSVTKAAIIGGPYPNNVAGQGSFFTRHLHVLQGQTLTVGQNGLVLVDGSLRYPGATIQVLSGGSFLQTDASLGDPETNARSLFRVERMGLSGASTGYSYVSSPVQGVPMSSVSSRASLPGTRLKYFEGAADGSQRWVDVPPDELLEPGRGYLMVTPGLLTFAGQRPFNQNGSGWGSSAPITRTPLPSGNGFNAVGNPFPSDLDMLAFLTQNGPAPAGNGATTAEAWFWRANNSTQISGAGTFVSMTLLTPPAEAYAATGQGFYVRAAALGTANVEFRNNQRTERSGRAPDFFRSEEERFTRFRLKLESTDGTTDRLLLGFGPRFTTGVDLGWDGEKMDGNQRVNLAARQANGTRYAVAALPVPDQNFRLPLTVQVAAAGSYTFAAEAVPGQADEKLFLVDRQTNEHYYLEVDRPHTLTLQAGNYRDRFYLARASEVVGNQGATEVRVWTSGHLMVVRAGAGASLELADLQGRVLARHEQLANGAVLAAEVPTAGVYLLRVAGPLGTLAQRVWLAP
ncbi:MAG: S8 family serine peptidase [Bernardetiaceae bacterium]|nr:S8 family serine peptidase [Bernardetiaceae bacterium]